jgi:deazaflavin-dependent oxidoreductase (nitroreductase family)
MAQRYSPAQKLLHKIFSTRATLLFLPHLLYRLDGLFLKLSSNRLTVTQLLSGLPMLMLTTTGAKTGLQRTTPLLYVRDPQNAEKFVLIGSNWGRQGNPAWYFNLKAHPIAICSIDGQSNQYSAQEINGAEYDRFWNYAVETYQGYALYRKIVGERHIPILLMSKVEAIVPD